MIGAVAGANVFHIKQDPENIRVLSKAVGGRYVSGLHYDPKDIIKISRIEKSERVGVSMHHCV
tara:strand:+ start:501 stop:689 length:189 start_codon:yes stop_codon:yes gene_type:complete